VILPFYPSFRALVLLVWQQKGHPDCKVLSQQFPRVVAVAVWLWWQLGLVVTSLGVSTKLLYVEPG